jgi:transcriptional regulator with XRE-family HTH domain
MNTLRTYRKARGLTQRRLAAKVHMTQDQICKLENAQLTPWRHQANALAIVLGVTAERLFPDGFKTELNYNNGPATHEPEPLYMPPEEPVFIRRYPPRDFDVMCWKCKAHVTMATGASLGFGDDPACPYCGAEFGDIVPLEEAARP